MRRLHLVGSVLLLFLGSVAISAQNNTVPPLQRVIDKPFEVMAHPPPCSGAVPNAAFLMGMKAQVLTGSERLPNRCELVDDPSTDYEKVELQGMTVEQAMNKLVEIDPRYRWAELDGVIVLRPVQAWSDPDNPLNRAIAGFSMRDRNYRGALDLFRAALFGEPPSTRSDYEGRNELVRRKFSVGVSPGPAIDALGSIVRAHGALSWNASYKAGQASVDDVVIALHTFEGEGTLTQRQTQQ